jgi:hypothetical protein
VYEVRRCVVTDTSSVHGEGGVAHLGGGYAGDADIDGFGFHVLAVHGDAVSVLAEEVVAPGRAVAADDVDLAVGTAEAAEKVVEQVELLQVVVLYVSGTVVAEKVVELGDGAGQVMVADAINDIDVFAGVEMVKTKTIGFGTSRGSGVGAQADHGAAECEGGGEKGFPELHDTTDLLWECSSAGELAFSSIAAQH